jgi:S1-C subfamily serine protease
MCGLPKPVQRCADPNQHPAARPHALLRGARGGSLRTVCATAVLAVTLLVTGCGGSPTKAVTGASGTLKSGATTPTGPGGTTKVNTTTPTRVIKARATSTPEGAPPVTTLVAEDQTGVIRVNVQTCSESVVGTGFLVGRRMVATVEHVVDSAAQITLKHNGKIVGTGKVVGEDSARDVALIQTSRPIAGHIFRLADRAEVVPGFVEV